MSEFTPGPWRIVEDEYCDSVSIRAVEGDLGSIYEEICESVTPSNAPLIAAAPELLAALKEVLAEYEDYSDGWEQGSAACEIVAAAKRVINKAEPNQATDNTIGGAKR